MSWMDYLFGTASRVAKKTFGDLRAEFQAGKEGKPSPGAKQRAPAPASRPAGPPWWQVLKVPRGATLAEVTAAYRELARQNHPDKVAHLSEQIRRVADQETRRINAAYEEAQKALGGRRR
jgi:hypothetical protein